MNPKKGWLALAGVCLSLVAAVALATGTGPAPATAPAPSPAPAPKAAPKAAPGPHRDWKNISLLYLSDIKGKVEPCG